MLAQSELFPGPAETKRAALPLENLLPTGDGRDFLGLPPAFFDAGIGESPARGRSNIENGVRRGRGSGLTARGRGSRNRSLGNELTKEAITVSISDGGADRDRRDDAATFSALYVNATQKRSPEPSNTDGLIERSAQIMRRLVGASLGRQVLAIRIQPGSRSAWLASSAHIRTTRDLTSISHLPLNPNASILQSF